MDETKVSHYELRRLLGRGGMGEVYEALDIKARRLVALKFVAPELAADPEAFQRFEAEALHAAAMNHPHIATLFEFEPEGARPFIAMEMVTGPTLRERIDQGPFDVPEALGIARDVAAALAYAHRRGVVHRDIKPENLMFDEEGRIKVMDFGLARALSGTRLTMVGTSLGTPSYMSPEAIQGTTGPPTDVFALGLVLAEMITGQKVFQGESPLAEMFAIANIEPPPLREKRPDVPEAVESLAARLIEKDPEKRPDAATAARELAELTGMRLSQLDLTPPDPGVAIGSRATTGATTVAMDTNAGRRPAPWRRVAMIVGALVIVAVIAGAAWIQRSTAGARARRQDAVLQNNQALEALRTGDLAAAQSHVSQALARDPRYGEALFNQAVLYERRGQLDSAAAVYTDLARSKGKNPPFLGMVLYNLGDLDLRGNLSAQAADHLTQSFAYDSSRWEVYNNLGYALVQAGKPREALSVLERGLARFAGVAPLHKNAALALHALDRDPEAIDHLNRALEQDGNLTSARGLRARLRARTGDLPGALTDWGIYQAANPPPDPTEKADLEREMVERGVAPPTR